MCTLEIYEKIAEWERSVGRDPFMQESSIYGGIKNGKGLSPLDFVALVTVPIVLLENRLDPLWREVYDVLSRIHSSGETVLCALKTAPPWGTSSPVSPISGIVGKPSLYLDDYRKGKIEIAHASRSNIIQLSALSMVAFALLEF